MTHGRLLDFIEFGADRITLIYGDGRKLVSIENETISWLKPILNETPLTKYDRGVNAVMAQQSKLYRITHIKLIEFIGANKAKPVLEHIAAETSLSYSWLVSFMLNRCGNPAVNRVETLYEFLSGHELEVR